MTQNLQSRAVRAEFVKRFSFNGRKNLQLSLSNQAKFMNINARICFIYSRFWCISHLCMFERLVKFRPFHHLPLLCPLQTAWKTNTKLNLHRTSINIPWRIAEWFGGTDRRIVTLDWNVHNALIRNGKFFQHSLLFNFYYYYCDSIMLCYFISPVTHESLTHQMPIEASIIRSDGP